MSKTRFYYHACQLREDKQTFIYNQNDAIVGVIKEVEGYMCPYRLKLYSYKTEAMNLDYAEGWLDGMADVINAVQNR